MEINKRLDFLLAHSYSYSIENKRPRQGSTTEADCPDGFHTSPYFLPPKSMKLLIQSPLLVLTICSVTGDDLSTFFDLFIAPPSDSMCPLRAILPWKHSTDYIGIEM